MIKDDQMREIVAAGVKILKVYDPDGTQSWWAVTKFDSALVVGDEATEFHTVTGVEITDFATTNHTEQSITSYIRKLVEIVDNAKSVVCKFHHGIKWKLYVS